MEGEGRGGKEKEEEGREKEEEGWERREGEFRRGRGSRNTRCVNS